MTHGLPRESATLVQRINRCHEAFITALGDSRLPRDSETEAQVHQHAEIRFKVKHYLYFMFDRVQKR